MVNSSDSMSWSLVTPSTLQRTLKSLNPDASLSEDAAQYLSDVFNRRTQEALLDIYRFSTNRALTAKKEAFTEHSAVEHHGRANYVNYSCPLDVGLAEVEVSEVARFLKLPPDCAFSLPTAQDTHILGQIKRFFPPLENPVTKKPYDGAVRTLPEEAELKPSPVVLSTSPASCNNEDLGQCANQGS